MSVKGSRDPLGIQPIWTRLGRHVVGNLTTVSTSVRDFTTTIIGYYLAERVANEERGNDLAADCIIVYKVDRLSRSLLDFARIIEVFDRGFAFTASSKGV